MKLTNYKNPLTLVDNKRTKAVYLRTNCLGHFIKSDKGYQFYPNNIMTPFNTEVLEGLAAHCKEINDKK